MGKIKKILIFRTEHIGDFLLSIGGIKSLKLAYPNSKLTVVVGPWNVELAKSVPYIDEVLEFNNPFVKRYLKIKDIIRIFVKDFWKIRGKIKEINSSKWDLLVIFSNRKFNKIFMKMIKAKKKIADFSFQINQNDQQRQLNMLKKFGIKKVYKISELKKDEKDLQKVEKFISKNNLNKSNMIIIQPFSPDENKNWSNKKWAKLIKKIYEEDKKIKFVLIGAPGEKERIELILKKIESKKGVNAAGIFNLVQVYHLIKKSKLFISIDSGIKHITELTKVPSIILFGPTYNKMWAPTRENDYLIKKNSMEDISNKEVINKIKEIYE